MASLLNKKAVKTMILNKLEQLRPQLGFNRVSGDAYTHYDAKLQLMIEEDIKKHPSVGKTFKPE